MPEQQPPELTEEEPIGGEIRVRRGGSPRWLGWSIYSLHAYAAVYLLVHPSVGHREVNLVFAGLIGAWLLFFALTKRTPEI